VMVEPDLSLAGHPEVFVAGDLACVPQAGGRPLPGTAPVAIQQGRYLAELLRREGRGEPRRPFRYRDKGSAATIGRSRALVDLGRVRLAGFAAWIAWLVIHIYYLVGFRNRVLVVLQWAWSYLTFGRGARLIVGRDWRFYASAAGARSEAEPSEGGPPPG
jgi:NADH dehydrogenase